MFTAHIDYTTRRLGAHVWWRRITRCEVCGRPGLYTRHTIAGQVFEHWLHAKHREGLSVTTIGCGGNPAAPASPNQERQVVT